LDNPDPDPVEEETISNPNPKNSQYPVGWTPKSGSCTPLVNSRERRPHWTFAVHSKV